MVFRQKKSIVEKHFDKLMGLSTRVSNYFQNIVNIKNKALLK